MNELETRRVALALALQVNRCVSPSPDEIVAAAQKFFDFLSNAPEPAQVFPLPRAVDLAQSDQSPRPVA